MKRRALIRQGWALLPLFSHTPYPQWKVYRQRHLFIVINKADAESDELGHAVAQILTTDLPASRAMITRAPNAARIASLISTKQLDVALLTQAEVAWLAKSLIEPVELRTLAKLGNHLLICRDDFPARHAYLIAQTLWQHRELAIAENLAEWQGELPPWHSGVIAYLNQGKRG